MTTFATQPDIQRRIAEIDARTRGAWAAYRDELRDLDGRAYEEAEAASWEHLQGDLRDLQAQRVALAPAGVTR